MAVYLQNSFDMANTMDGSSSIQCSTFHECALLPIFSNFGWESIYKKNMTNIIKILDIYNDISRLYALIHFETPNKDIDVTINKLRDNRISQHPDALQLTNNLKDIIPDADPIYLDLVGEMYAFNHNGLSEYLEEITTKKKNYPKLQEYNSKVMVLKTINSLTINFKVDEFLRLCPDPEKYFKTIKLNLRNSHYHESISYLCNRFSLLHMVHIRSSLHDHNFNLTKTVEALEVDSTLRKLKNKRKSIVCNNLEKNFKTTDNLEFLKEMAYLDHKEDILNFIKSEQTIHQIKIEEAKSAGHLRTCECCYNDELLDSEVYCCPAGHYFCSSCIKKGTEVAVGSTKLEFKCFADCTEEFDLLMIKEFIDDKLYQRILRLKQAQEIKAAGIEGLETCAFCDYSVILSPDLKTINCLNPECRKETCRECREESHFPLRCDQIEKAPEVKVRTMIENKMTEVLIRTCYYCQRKFVKEDGCNKMTCSCGKQMCYICRQPVDSNYTHFYHTHVIENKCPLYTDENIVHTTAVEAAARLIMNELKMTQPELLRNINIDKILPDIKKNKFNVHQVQASPVDVNKVVATLIGQNVEDINKLKDMRTMGPPPPKKPRQ